MCGTKQVEIWANRDPYGNSTASRTKLHPLRVLELIPGLMAVVAFREDSNPQAILRVNCPRSLDYNACYRLPLSFIVMVTPCVKAHF